MDLDQLSRRDGALSGLLGQVRKWQRLDGEVKRLVPANLHPHFQTACVENGVLVLAAANNMAASRLKMILPSVLPQLMQIDGSIRDVSVRLVPKPPAIPRENSFRLSDGILADLESTAKKVEESNPALAQVLARMASRHRTR